MINQSSYEVDVRNLHDFLRIREISASRFLIEGKKFTVLQTYPADAAEHLQRCDRLAHVLKAPTAQRLFVIHSDIREF